MGVLEEAAKVFVSKCKNCGHLQISHKKTSFRDEQRAGSIKKAEDSECRDCRKEGKQCKNFE